MTQYCPVCMYPIPADTGRCVNCGYDLSCSYENRSTLVMLEEGEKSLLARRLEIDRQQKAEFQQLKDSLQEEWKIIQQLQEENAQLKEQIRSCAEQENRNKKRLVQLENSLSKLEERSEQMTSLHELSEQIEEMKKSSLSSDRKKTSGKPLTAAAPLKTALTPAGKLVSEGADLTDAKRDPDKRNAGDPYTAQDPEPVLGPRQGEIVTFGKFQSTLNGVRNPIRWIVLEVKDAQVLLISEEILDKRGYFRFGEPTREWNKSNLRTWLEEAFLYKAFDAEERDLLQENSEKHKVSILNKYEADYYLGSAEKAAASSTAYAESSSGYTKQGRPRCSWWLRSGDYIDEFGMKQTAPLPALNVSRGVRPVIRVSLDAFRDAGKA